MPLQIENDLKTLAVSVDLVEPAHPVFLVKKWIDSMDLHAHRDCAGWVYLKVI